MEQRTVISNILVIGAGAMGSQIAMTAALAGYPTTIHDVSQTQLDAAMAALRERADKMVDSGRLTTDQAEQAQARLRFSTQLENVSPAADFVIEAATERLDIKQEIFATLGHLAPPHAILATNSSTLGSSKVAEASGRPDRVCNMHFFNPVLVMECVEVVRHPGTSQATIDATMDLARRLGKSPVLINREIPGFVANRLMGAVQKEALALLAGGVANKEDIDTTARLALRHPMGPFELMDLVGLDVIADIARATHEETGDPVDAPDPAITALVSKGMFGRKSGAGWYSYAR
ncbi:3-hydroxyacyl-CoA dehydrogenase family protein [Arthrobacter sp. SDTb3-6]|uniref:3-hydroxyacyl-CoA dehydrogenase family protein n=1 Tax=Arthrobacter sp. SDTb3-6 TaxID=2713571 RepID=UPI00159E962E|nr:3-hydroxyacyl-CoA dehydrogenase family protein [Arthrobacter sp. SDTb3-6]NVN00378.1 3-hydroxyacyl-CoA dehydrogenase family protein [Arthrobacter sp. SDTb3-6]